MEDWTPKAQNPGYPGKICFLYSGKILVRFFTNDAHNQEFWISRKNVLPYEEFKDRYRETYRTNFDVLCDSPLNLFGFHRGALWEVECYRYI